MSRSEFEVCERDAKAVDQAGGIDYVETLGERVNTCQRELDASAGKLSQAERERAEVIRALRVENDVQREQLARQTRELERRVTPGRLVLWVGAALLTGYVVGRVHHRRAD